MEGKTLAHLLKREPNLSIADAQFILTEVADALSFVHAAGVLHRDIKPDNILIEAATGRPILTDFGIARALGVDAPLTGETEALGTPEYMAPEQTIAGQQVDTRADIYSLGVLGYRLLAGRVPFTAPTAQELAVQHASAHPVPLGELRPDVPLSLAAAIHRALEKNPGPGGHPLPSSALHSRRPCRPSSPLLLAATAMSVSSRWTASFVLLSSCASRSPG